MQAGSILGNLIFVLFVERLPLTEPFIRLDLSIKSMLERSVLNNAVDCTSQRLKWTSGARVMTIFNCFTCIWSLLMYLSIGGVLDFLVLKNAARRTRQRPK